MWWSAAPFRLLVNTLVGGERAELVILDHGLYREVKNDLRLAYASFWRAILRGDREGMKACADALGAGDMYPLLACAITRKPWNVILSPADDKTATTPSDQHSVGGEGSAGKTGHISNVITDLSRLAVKPDSTEEVSTLQSNVREYITQAFTMLARVNPDLLLLLKTNDCVQHVLTALGSSAVNYIYIEKWTSVALAERLAMDNATSRSSDSSSSLLASASSWTAWLHDASMATLTWLTDAMLG